MCEIGMTVTAAPAPKPAAVRPAAMPRRPGNHLSALPTQVPYTAPVPIPPTTAPTYSAASELAAELIIHAIPTRMPPPITTHFGPKRSTR